MDFDWGLFAGCLDGFDCVFVFCFDSDEAVFGTHGIHGKHHALDDFFGPALHDRRILVEQGLTLGTIRDDGIRLCGEFDMSGKPTAARANHAG